MTDKEFAEELSRKKAEARKEAREHSKWCGPSCQTFIESAYIRGRVERGYSKEELQRDYDLCHAVR